MWELEAESASKGPLTFYRKRVFTDLWHATDNHTLSSRQHYDV